MKTIAFACAALALSLSPALAQDKSAPAKVDRAVFDKMLADGFAKAPEDWRKKMELDETQRVCTETRNQPSNAQSAAVMEREAKAVKFPADGKYLGDMKAGHKVANTGTGGQFTDKPGTYVGGNCYACHQMDPKEVSYGTLGPSLAGYGRERNYDPEVIRDTWIKIYNSQAVVACSNMPRFGHAKVLTIDQIKDVMAYLFDRQSPVNQP